MSRRCACMHKRAPPTPTASAPLHRPTMEYHRLDPADERGVFETRQSATRDPPQLLACVVVACRENARVAAIHEVMQQIEAFVDSTRSCSLVRACDVAPIGLVRLVRRIAAREPEDIDPLVKHQIFTRALDHAVRHGGLEIVQWLVDEYLPTGKIRQPLNKAAASGRLEILQWLHLEHPRRMVWNYREILAAAEHDHFETVRWLYDLGHEYYGGEYYVPKLLVVAAKNGNLEMVEWVNRRRRESDILIARGYMDLAQFGAAKNGHRAVLEFMKAHFDCHYNRTCMTNAMRGGQLELMQWLHAQGVSSAISSDLENPVAKGQLELIAWVLQHLKLVEPLEVELAMTAAAAGGHLECVKLLHQHVVGQCSLDTMDKAAGNGHLEVVQWLHANRTEGCTVDAMNKAACNGHLEVVQWLHIHRSEGCTFFAMDWAAEENQLDVVQWLHENRSEGCSTSAMDEAAGNGHLEMVIWLHANRHEGCTAAAMDNAADNGHLDVVQWLHCNRSEGCTHSAMDDAAKNGHLDVLLWLDTNRSEGCSDDALCGAARNGRAAIVSWLLVHKPEMCTSNTLIYAAEGGDFEILQAISGKLRYVPQFSVKPFDSALRTKQYEVFEWLVREYGDRTPQLMEWCRRKMCMGVRTFDAYARSIVQELLSGMPRQN